VKDVIRPWANCHNVLLAVLASFARVLFSHAISRVEGGYAMDE
jgi:hypothetical protein